MFRGMTVQGKVASLALWVSLTLWSSVATFRSAPDEPSTDEQAVTVFLVRHAEKATDDPQDPNLSGAGKQRAQALARMLEHAGVTHLFSSAYRRTRQTLAPLAKLSDNEVVEYNVREPQALLTKLRELEGGSVAVVAGHSNTVPAMFQELSGKQASDLEESAYGLIFGEDAYDRLFVVTLMTDCHGDRRAVSAMEFRVHANG